MQSITTRRRRRGPQAVRVVQRYSGRDIDEAEARDGLIRGLKSIAPYAAAFWLAAAAVVIVGPRVLAATAGMP